MGFFIVLNVVPWCLIFLGVVQLQVVQLSYDCFGLSSYVQVHGIMLSVILQLNCTVLVCINKNKFLYVDHYIHLHLLRRNTLGITGEPGRLSNVGQIKEQHDHTFKANATATMRKRTVTERVDICLDVMERNIPCLGPFND